ncbi:MAG TPA: helix-turn-helix domain-containing protein, partial [Niabella sp.]|nr:helix-turn-helix domain-containing protein [Niabella sp.]
VIVNRSIEVSDPLVTEQTTDHSKGIISISAETEQLLISGLNEFENSIQFLKNGISLPVLAAQLNTNTKYLSYIIKLQKQADFNGYVNKLRINYVVTKLQKDPTWRQYKVSALADVSGFSSPSQFAAIFKSTTGLSPSAFLRQLSNNS